MRCHNTTLQHFNDEFLVYFVKLILQYHNKYRKEYEVNRLIFGLSSIFQHQTYLKLKPLLPLVFKLLVKLIKLVYNYRCGVDLDESENEDEEEVDYWCEERDKDCKTQIDKMDCVLYF